MAQTKLTLANLATLVKSYIDNSNILIGSTDYAADREAYSNLIVKIGKQIMIDSNFTDRLGELDGEELPYGTTIEEYFIDLTLPTIWSNINTEGSKDKEPALPSVEQCAYSYTLGRTKIKTTVPYDNVERAANNANDAGNMLAKILQRLGDSYNMFKFASKKQLLGNAIDKAVTAGLVTEIAAPTDTATGEAFIKQLKADIEAAKFAHQGGLNNTLIGASPSLIRNLFYQT